MTEAAYASAHISRIPAFKADTVSESEWRPVRHHLGIQAFGINAYVARSPGERIVGEHDELPEPGSDGQRHEELYYVGSGHATFRLAGESIEAPAGTFVFVRDPAVVRSAVARDPHTVVLAVGAQPGVAFQVSAWERRHTEGLNR